MIKLLHLPGLLLLATACQKLPSVEPATSRPLSGELAMVQASCGECHAVRRNEISRRSNAPSFSEIVNTDGATKETISVWLRGAHNYPSEMDFTLDDRKVESIVAYLLTLKDPKYRRAPD